MFTYVRTASAVAFFCGGLLATKARAENPFLTAPTQQPPSLASVDGDIAAKTGSRTRKFAQIIPSNAAHARSDSAGSAKNTSVSPSGISARPSQNSPTTSGAGAGSIPVPISPLPRVGLFPAVGKTLLEEGIDLHGIILDHYLVDTTAGPHPGHSGQILAIAPAADLDLTKLANIPGGTLHFQITFNTLRGDEPNFSDYAGGWLTGFQATPALSGNWVYPSYIAYEQKLLHDKLSLEVGRTSFYRYFFRPNALDVFANFSSVVQVDGDAPSVPFPTWGGRALYQVTPSFYTQVAAFADNFYTETHTPWAFGESLANGAQIFGEVGSRTEFFNSEYPENFELGFEWNTRHGYTYTKGSPLPTNAQFSAADYPGGGVIFFQGLQTLWRGGRKIGGPPTNIAVYGSADGSVDKPQPIDFDAIIGFNFTGFVPGRPFDALGVQAHYQRLSQVETAFESRFHNIFAGPGPNQNRNNWAFEAVYNISFENIVNLKPKIEYFINPDNFGDPTFRRRPSDGFEVGVLAVVSLGRLFGTSSKPF